MATGITETSNQAVLIGKVINTSAATKTPTTPTATTTMCNRRNMPTHHSPRSDATVSTDAYAPANSRHRPRSTPSVPIDHAVHAHKAHPFATESRKTDDQTLAVASPRFPASLRISKRRSTAPPGQKPHPQQAHDEPTHHHRTTWRPPPADTTSSSAQEPRRQASRPPASAMPQKPSTGSCHKSD